MACIRAWKVFWDIFRVSKRWIGIKFSKYWQTKRLSIFCFIFPSCSLEITANTRGFKWTGHWRIGGIRKRSISSLGNRNASLFSRFSSWITFNNIIRFFLGFFKFFLFLLFWLVICSNFLSFNATIILIILKKKLCLLTNKRILTSTRCLRCTTNVSTFTSYLWDSLWLWIWDDPFRLRR